MNSPEQNNSTFSIKRVFRATFKYIYENKVFVLNSLKYPFLGAWLASILSSEKAGDFYLFKLIIALLPIYFYIILAVQCHRIIFLYEQSEKLIDLLIWRQTHIKKTSVLTTKAKEGETMLGSCMHAKTKIQIESKHSIIFPEIIANRTLEARGSATLDKIEDAHISDTIKVHTRHSGIIFLTTLIG